MSLGRAANKQHSWICCISIAGSAAPTLLDPLHQRLGRAPRAPRQPRLRCRWPGSGPRIPVRSGPRTSRRLGISRETAAKQPYPKNRCRIRPLAAVSKDAHAHGHRQGSARGQASTRTGNARRLFGTYPNGRCAMRVRVRTRRAARLLHQQAARV